MVENKTQEEYIKAYQQWQIVVMQKEQMVLQLSEIENTINELQNIEGDVYKITGSVMIKKKKEDVLKDLKEKKDLLELKIKSLEKQEKTLREKLENLHKAASPGAS